SGASSAPIARMGALKASGCCALLVGDNLGHRSVLAEGPAVADRHVTRGDGLLDQSPPAVRREADQDLPGLGAGAAAFAGGVRIGRGALPHACSRSDSISAKNWC